MISSMRHNITGSLHIPQRYYDDEDTNQFIPVTGFYTTNETETGYKNTGISSLYLPKSIKSIPSDTFSGCSSLASITYSGTTTEFKSITRGTGWHTNVPATEVICSNGTCGLDDTI